MGLPDWCYSQPRPLTFPAWLLKGDIVELDGQAYCFHGLIRRFKNLDEMREHFTAEKLSKNGK